MYAVGDDERIQRWNPWRALRERSHIELRFADLGPHRGLWQRDGLGDIIVLDVTLDRRSRRCVLAHELIHAERGIGHGRASVATMELEEELTRREVARRLVPAAALRAFIGTRIDTDGGVTCADVEEEFDVDPEVAAKALELLTLQPSPPTLHAPTDDRAT
jgi:hypothetical protein